MTDSEKAEYERVIGLLTAKVEELLAANAKLRSEKSDALSVLKEAYNDPDVPPALRIKAAGLALPHEVPRLQPVPPPLDLVAAPSIPLAELVTLQRARADLMEAEARDIEVLPSGLVRVLPRPGSNGSGDSSTD
jgi:hypothetical protein